METKTLDTNNKTSITSELNLEQLIESALNTNENTFEYRDELINRGNDNVYTRILIKKTCKASLANLETYLSHINSDTHNEITKSIKSKFLNLVSILDKLQLEWQKYDLGLKK